MKKILIIEDDAPLSWLLEQMLKNKYQVFIINDGLEAYSWLTDGNECDLIISDLNLPSLSGIELLENLQQSLLYNHIPVIILSGDEELAKKCIALGAFSYNLKPFKPQQLVTDMKRALAYQTEKAVGV